MSASPKLALCAQRCKSDMDILGNRCVTSLCGVGGLFGIGVEPERLQLVLSVAETSSALGLAVKSVAVILRRSP